MTHLTETKEGHPLLDPEAETVAAQVVTKLAGPPTSSVGKRRSERRGPYWWLDHEELLSEAIIACMTSDVLTGATSPGAFHVRLMHKLKDTQKTERKWRWDRLASTGLANDYADDFATVTDDDDGSPARRDSDTSWRGVTDPREWDDEWVEPDEDSPPHPDLGRSRLLDIRKSMADDEFIAWADQELGSAWGKKRDVRVLLHGSSTAQEAMWSKYAKGKRVAGGTRVKVDGVEATAADFQRTLNEEWKARYRWNRDQHPLVMSTDGQTVEVARVLRQPIR